MDLIKAAYRTWDDYFFGPILPYPLAAFRILFGAYLLCYFLKFVTNVPLLFSDQGIYVPFLIKDIAPPPIVALMMYGFTMLLAMAFMVGFHTRFVTPLLFVAFLYHYLLSLAVHAVTYDILIIILLFVLSFASLDKVWSVVFFWQPPADREEVKIIGWANRFLCLYLSIFYLGMVAYKLTNLNWYSGYCLEMNFHGMWATPLAFWVVNQNLPMSFFSALTYGALVVEFLCSFGLYNRRIQNYVFFLGFMFHFLVAILLSIPEFLLVPLIYVLFVDPVKVKRTGEYLWSIF
jgi:hypothetical protein